jgi:SAM-dependent methyltransferase
MVKFYSETKEIYGSMMKKIQKSRLTIKSVGFFLVNTSVTLMLAGCCCTASNAELSKAVEAKDVYVLPDSEKFNEADAVRFNGTAKNRRGVYVDLAAYLVKRFDLSKKQGIGIDLGGGPGDLVVELSERVPGFYWINTDINTWNANLFAEDARKHGVDGRSAFVFADACYLPFRDNYADLILSRGAYQFWGDLDAAISEVHRVLKSGGQAFIGRGVAPDTAQDKVADLRNRRVIGGPKYDKEVEVARFKTIMKKLGIKEFEIIGEDSSDASHDVGIWLYFKKR